jgi:hypothetical protein
VKKSQTPVFEASNLKSHTVTKTGFQWRNLLSQWHNANYSACFWSEVLKYIDASVTNPRQLAVIYIYIYYRHTPNLLHSTMHATCFSRFRPPSDIKAY